jgi:alkanesulfonate monooxygenase SsuD/methylene tetrahydromethanopterin reductase-like flavin-dependent oxidoreductase (luciferase family)
MKLGFFTMPVHPPAKDWRRALAEDRKAFLLADALGYTEGFVGSHYTDLVERITSPLVFLASLASDVSRMRLGPATINLPNHHPLEVAADIAMLDHMLDGRLNLGLSPGGLLSDAEAFDTLDCDRTAMFIEGVEILEKLWTGSPPYDIRGDYWRISTAQTWDPESGMGEVPRPLQMPGPPIFTTVVEPHSRGIRKAAERGWIPISANFTLPEWLRSHWDMAEAGAVDGAKGLRIADWRVARTIHVDDQAGSAKDYVFGTDSPFRFYYENLLRKFTRFGKLAQFTPEGASENSVPEIDNLLEALVIYGDPMKVADDIEALRERTGPFGTLLYTGVDWANAEAGEKSMRLMAEQVAPHIA